MRLVARIPDQRQVGALVDSLKNIGIDRSHMVISDLTEVQEYGSVEEAIDQGVSLTNTERAGMSELEPFAKGVKGLKGDTGIIVAVKAPKHKFTQIRSMMEQSGAEEIVED